MRKLTRTISGVTPVAVMTRPMGCPGECVYCPTFASVPQSYTPESSAVLRGTALDFNSARQVELRLNILAAMGHPLDKIELIIMGGTFLASPVEYQYEFIKGCYDALNSRPSETLEEAQRINETTQRRCVGLCVETRPDWCGEAEIERMLNFGTTRVELGVQTLDDEVYRLVKRGHTVSDVVEATRRLKNAGLKVHYHWMPGLPGITPEKDLELAGQLFDDDMFRPDGLKLYPTMVVNGTELEEWWRQGKYRPYPSDVMVGLILDIKKKVPGYVRISRVLRDIPARFIVAGLKNSLRESVQKRLAEEKNGCRCIRCREYGRRLQQGHKIGEPQLKRYDYEASGGREVFLSFEDDEGTLFGLLRLRLQDCPPSRLEELGKVALVRELHIYGPEVSLGKRRKAAAQHRGLGRELLKEAERVALEEFGDRSIAALSGIGAREYYAGLGYHLQNGYMVKKS